ncbi:MAG: putative spermidine/putrescine transport system substrate-binding protein [Thermomicrobiales bacterium]|jgi:putative spermidine/putrescine transport system substrate-binding protein|nr:putative spermidine/putrescine transport system substrate-binding protein [Thermomicrobiales bacterium]MEA2594323.1 putative spermidine/putrescine transport system substrate-binding protein [Thermomicrobiales bacterium]
MINVLQQALNRRRLLQGGAALGSAAALGGLRLPAAFAQDAPPLPADASDMEALIAGAQKENKIVSYGMPREWANLGEMWDTFKAKYNIKDWEDTDMGSATEIAKFLAEKDNPVADIGDIGILFAPTAVQFGVAAPFKNDTWAEIPDWAKHPDGLWATQYYGSLSFWVNTDLVDPVPRTWQDLLKSDYKGLVSIDDPRTAAQGNFTVIGAAFANGGDETNVQPGLDYFKQMNAAGNFGPTGLDLAKLQKGEIVLAIGWDYLGLGYRDSLEGQVNIEVVIPEDGSTVGPYVSIINQWAPHPYAARLMRNYILSPEGQLIYAKGYASPILPSVEIPADLQAKRPPQEAYASVKPIKDWAQAVASFQKIADTWGNEVLGQ